MSHASLKLASFGLCVLAWANEAHAEGPLSCKGDFDYPNDGFVWKTRSADVEDLVTVDDATQEGRLQPYGPSTCSLPVPAPPLVELSTPFPYRAHTYKNRSTSAACVTVLVYALNDVGPNYRVPPFHVTAYLGAFDATDVAKNYLGTSAGAGGYEGPTFASITVPALADFVVVLSSDWPISLMLDSTTQGFRPHDSAVHYALYVAGCGELDPTRTTENVESLAPDADADAKTDRHGAGSGVQRSSNKGSNTDRVTSPAAPPAAEAANTDDATLPADGASGCAMTARTAAPITPFALTLGALAMLRRRRRS